MATYTFSISLDFPNQRVEPHVLKQEIAASSISVAVSYIMTGNDDCDIVFPSNLSGAEQTTLEGLVAAHLGNHKSSNAERLLSFLQGFGPAEGFPSAYQETTPAGQAFWTSCIWYTDSGKTKKIGENNLTYNADKTVNTEVFKVYADDGTTVLTTATDTYDYSGGNLLTPKVNRVIVAS